MEQHWVDGLKLADSGTCFKERAQCPGDRESSNRSLSQSRSLVISHRIGVAVGRYHISSLGEPADGDGTEMMPR